MLLQVAVFPTHRSMLLHVVVFPATTILMHSKLLLCGKQPIYLATFTRSGSRLCIGVNITPSLDPLSPNSMKLSLGEKYVSSLRRPPGYNLMEVLNGACRQRWEGFQRSQGLHSCNHMLYVSRSKSEIGEKEVVFCRKLFSMSPVPLTSLT